MYDWLKRMQPKQAERFWGNYLWTYRRYGCRTIFDAYKNPSGAKEGVWANRYAAMWPHSDDFSVQKLTVVGAGSFAFSVAWIEYSDKEYVFRYDTAYTSYWFPLQEEALEETNRVLVWPVGMDRHNSYGIVMSIAKVKSSVEGE